MNMNNIKLTIVVLITACIIHLADTSLWAQDNALEQVLDQARQAGIEEAEIQQLRDRAGQRGISGEEILRILDPAIQLAEQNLPHDIIVQKALEGFAKGVPSGRIIPVLDNMKGQILQSSGIVDPWIQRERVRNFIGGGDSERQNFRNEMIKAGMKTMSHAEGQAMLQSVLQNVEEQGVLDKTSPPALLSAVNIIPDLPDAARRPDQVSGLITEALNRGFRANELQALPVAMQAAQRRSQLPAASVLEGITNQMKNGIPAEQILQNLFNGNISAGPPGNIPRGLENRPDRSKGRGGN